MDEIRELIKERIVSDVGKLDTLEQGSKERAEAVDDIVKLYKAVVEDIKSEAECGEKFHARCDEMSFKDEELAFNKEKFEFEKEAKAREEELTKRQAKDQKWGQYIKLGVEAGAVILPLVCYGVWLDKGTNYEREGIYKSTWVRNLINLVKPKTK